jgi:hypothetical protein
MNNSAITDFLNKKIDNHSADSYLHSADVYSNSRDKKITLIFRWLDHISRNIDDLYDDICLDFNNSDDLHKKINRLDLDKINIDLVAFNYNDYPTNIHDFLFSMHHESFIYVFMKNLKELKQDLNLKH